MQPDLHGTPAWISGSSVNFRTSPDLSGKVIRLLARGTRVERLRREGDWVCVRVGEAQGYIHADYVSDHAPADPTNTPSQAKVRLVVKKSQRLLEMWRGDSLVDSFPIGLGWAPEGHKQAEGDGRTPEGEYYVCVKNANSSFYLSLGISYPNKADAAAALADGRIDQATHDAIARAIDAGRKPDWYTPLGGEIMIHGCGGSSDWTAGCVAVDNEAMDILFAACPVGTAILILP